MPDKKADPTGTYNPADFITQLNGTYRNDDGTTRSGSRGTIFEKNIRKLQPDTQAYFNELLSTEAMNARKEGRALNKWDLRTIEHQLKAKYGNVDPHLKHFDISSWYSTDRRIAKELNTYMNSLPSGTQMTSTQPAQTEQPAQETQQAAPVEEKPTATPPQQNDKPNGTQVENSNKGVAGAQPGDYIIRSDGSTHVLTKGDIEWAKKRVGVQNEPKTPVQPEQPAQETPAATEPKVSNTAKGASSKAQQSIEENYVDPNTGKKPAGGSSNFLNTGGFGARPEKEAAPAKPKYVPTAEEQALLDEAATLRKQVGSRNTSERTKAQKRLLEIQPQLNEIAKKQKTGGTVEEKPTATPPSQSQAQVPDYNAVAMTQQATKQKADDLGAMAQNPVIKAGE